MRKEKNRLILRLRLRAMTIDGMVDESGPWFMAKRGGTFLGSGHLGACTRIGRRPVGGDFHVVECGTAQLRLSACSREEIQAIGTTFGIPGDIDFHELDDAGKAVHFPYVARSLYESPF